VRDAEVETLDVMWRGGSEGCAGVELAEVEEQDGAEAGGGGVGTHGFHHGFHALVKRGPGLPVPSHQLTSLLVSLRME
jgi:hypothetical protein